MNHSIGAALLTLIGALSACSFAPTYRIPDSSPPGPVYQEAGEWRQAQPFDTEARGPWWMLFHDKTLDELEAKVDGANQNLKAGLARLQAARAATRIARADLFPTLNAASSASRQGTSQHSPTYLSGSEKTFNNFDLNGDLSYEIDLWGRVRNSVNAAKANQQASAADLATLDLELHAELAADYYTLRSEDAEQVLLQETVADYAKSLELTQGLYKGGAAAVADVDQAQAQLETAHTQATDIALQRAQTEHAIAVLTGENPSLFHLDSNPLAVDTTPPLVDSGLPSTLLERRPDVAAAERRVAAANAQIGVARAAFFPVFSLVAAAGVDSTNVSTWLTGPSRLWSVGPQGLLTLFDAGRRKAVTAQARAQYDEQVADYRNAVLTAYREVEDALAALHRLEEEGSTESAAVTATAKALEQARYRYRAGLVTYLEVATTETTALQAQLSRVNILNRRMEAGVLLIKALGGGWPSEELGRDARGDKTALNVGNHVVDVLSKE